MTDNRRRDVADYKAAYGPAAGWDAYFVGRRRFAEYSGMTDIEKAAAHVEEGALGQKPHTAAFNFSAIYRTLTNAAGTMLCCPAPAARRFAARGTPKQQKPALKAEPEHSGYDTIGS